MRPTSALARSPGRPWRRIAVAACALAVLAATAGCNATASPSAPASFWPCPPGQHFTEHYQEWGCWPS